MEYSFSFFGECAISPCVKLLLGILLSLYFLVSTLHSRSRHRSYPCRWFWVVKENDIFINPKPIFSFPSLLHLHIEKFLHFFSVNIFAQWFLWVHVFNNNFSVFYEYFKSLEILVSILYQLCLNHYNILYNWYRFSKNIELDK